MTQLLIPVLAFGAVATAFFVVAQYLSIQTRIHGRLPTSSLTDVEPGQPLGGIHSFIATRFDERRFGIVGNVREKLRHNLIRAGFFKEYAVNYYIFARLASVIGLPTIVYIVSTLSLRGIPSIAEIALVSIATLIGLGAPDAYIARRQRLLVQKYRQIFPDFLDLVVICIDAGLSLGAALDRVKTEIMKQSRELGINLEIMGAEIRAGRSMIEALESFADRLGLDESGSFVTMLRQSFEIGSDVGDSLRIYSDEMRDKRLLRAEEMANKLSVKMVLPLSFFIFPVVLLVVMLPVVIKLLTVLK